MVELTEFQRSKLETLFKPWAVDNIITRPCLMFNDKTAYDYIKEGRFMEVFYIYDRLLQYQELPLPIMEY